MDNPSRGRTNYTGFQYKNENLEDSDDDQDVQSVHSISESIHDFSRIVTTRHKEPGSYLANSGEGKAGYGLTDSINKRDHTAFNNYDGTGEDYRIPTLYDSQTKPRKLPGGGNVTVGDLSSHKQYLPQRENNNVTNFRYVNC